MNRTHITVLAIATAVGLVAITNFGTTPSNPGHGSGQGVRASSEDASKVNKMAHASESSQRTLVDISELRFIDEMGRPIAGVAVFEARAERSWLTTPDDCERSSDSGGIAINETWIGRELAYIADGYVAQIEEWRTLDARIVTLVGAEALEVRCMSSGRPSVNCVVVVSTRPIPANAEVNASDYPIGVIVADPRSKAGVWRSMTDENGRCTISCLPTGKHYLAVFHDYMVPSGELGSGDLAVEAGSSEVVVNLVEMHAVAAAVPGQIDIATHVALVDRRELSKAIGWMARARHVTRRLQENLGTKLVRVGLPKEGDEPLVRIKAMGTDGSLWGGEWPMQPISELTSPFFLEGVELGVGTVNFKIEYADGRPFSSTVNIVGTAGSARPVIKARNGATMSLPEGSYTWELDHANPWIPNNDKPVVKVADGINQTWHIVLPNLTPMTIRPKILGDALDRSIWVSLRAEGGSYMWIWRPQNGAIETLVPTGVILLAGTAPGYGRKELELNATKDDKLLDVELVLDRK